MTDFMTGLLTNPRFDFIFAKSSVLSTNQKTKVVFVFTHRLLALQDFDPTPFSKELAGMWGSPEFEQFWVTGKDGAKTLNFDLYFEKYNFTREQKAMIIEDFHDIQKLLSKRNRVAIIIPFFYRFAHCCSATFLHTKFFTTFGMDITRCGLGYKNHHWISECCCVILFSKNYLHYIS